MIATRTARAGMCMIAAAWLASVLALAGLNGCNGVGRALVDRHVVRPVGDAGCPPPPECDASVPALDLEDSLPSGALQVSFSDCGANPERCPLEPTPNPSNPADDRDAGASADRDNSASTCSANQPAQALDHAALDCTNIRVALDPQTTGQVFQTTYLSHVNLAIVSATPVTLTLDESSFQHVFVRLEGPVTLRLTHAIDFNDVGLAGQANAHGAPRIAIEDVAKATLVSVGEATGAFEGELVITRSKLDHTRLSADVIELSSVHAETIAISGRSVLAADTALFTATLDLGNGAFSASHFNDVHVSSCDALALISTSVNDGVLPACRNEPLHAYSSSFSATDVDGAIDSDNSSWDGVRFGLHAQTEVLGWGTSIEASTFCDHGSALRFGAEANRVKCSACVSDALPMPLCVSPTGQVGAIHNLCAALAPKDGVVPRCEGTFPTRPRPQ